MGKILPMGPDATIVLWLGQRDATDSASIRAPTQQEALACFSAIIARGDSRCILADPAKTQRDLSIVSELPLPKCIR